ncbi:hypothetical protein K474DRAFT_1713123 [Panus rudis PR-1116 ss-1]|nr:hypothetical protein K474DRAFT_1713123 [Panus rudis PR-1116 ss-1]
MVKISSLGAKDRFAEVYFYFQIRATPSAAEVHNVAMVSLFSDYDEALFKESYNTLLVCRYQGDSALQVIDAQQIAAVVAMMPLPLTTEELSQGQEADFACRFYVAEKPGLDVAYMGGMEDVDNETEM